MDQEHGSRPVHPDLTLSFHVRPSCSPTAVIYSAPTVHSSRLRSIWAAASLETIRACADGVIRKGHGERILVVVSVLIQRTRTVGFPRIVDNPIVYPLSWFSIKWHVRDLTHPAVRIEAQTFRLHFGHCSRRHINISREQRVFSKVYVEAVCSKKNSTPVPQV